MTSVEQPIVLVAEDEPIVRYVVVAFLEDEGFVVIEAEHGGAALEIIESDRALHLLFTDIHMPHMNGLSLARRTRELRPEVGILLTSSQLAASETPADMRFVAKPYQHHEVADALRQLIAA